MQARKAAAAAAAAAAAGEERSEDDNYDKEGYKVHINSFQIPCPGC